MNKTHLIQYRLLNGAWADMSGCEHYDKEELLRHLPKLRKTKRTLEDHSRGYQHFRVIERTDVVVEETT